MNLNKLELKRKLFHLFSGIVIVLLLYFNILGISGLLIVLSICVLVSFLSLYIKIPVFHWFLKNLDRSNDSKRFPAKGAVFYILGINIVVLLFDKNIVLASILILSFGDVVTSLFGHSFGFTGHPFNKNKTIEGTLAAIVVSFFAALVFVNIVQAFAGSVVGMFVESFDIKVSKNIVIDDNLTIPIVSALAMYAVGL